jgi:hypothetical protein
MRSLYGLSLAAMLLVADSALGQLHPLGRQRGRRHPDRCAYPRLLFNAAMQARRNTLWEPYYQRLRNRGLSTTAAFVALGRRLAKVCFALLQNDSQFDPLSHRPACTST